MVITSTVLFEAGSWNVYDLFGNRLWFKRDLESTAKYWKISQRKHGFLIAMFKALWESLSQLLLPFLQDCGTQDTSTKFWKKQTYFKMYAEGEENHTW